MLSLDDIIEIINAPNGIPQDIWFNIIEVIGEQEFIKIKGVVNNVSNYNGLYFLSTLQRDRLQDILPSFFILRCGRCDGPFHPATGHAFSETIVACNVCYGRFAVWQMTAHGQTIIPYKQKKKLEKKKRKEEKRLKQEQKRLQQEEKIREAKYGKPRIAQIAQFSGPGN